MELRLPEEERTIVGSLVEGIRRYNHFLITTHTTSDGDAVASECAVALLLKRLGKTVTVVNPDKVPKIYRFLPGSGDITVWRQDLSFDPPVEAIIVIDCGTRERTGAAGRLIVPGIPVFNIDHHFRNDRFGTLNWVGGHYAAAGEMVYFLLKEFGDLSVDEASCIYTAILTDTGSFLYHFSPYTFMILGELIAAGIDPAHIARKVYMERPLGSVRLLSLCLQTLSFDGDLRACWARITMPMCAETGTGEEDSEGFIDVLKSIEEADVSFLMKEKKNGVKVSLRSRGVVDVENVTRQFGGGGHREAAGCFLHNVSCDEAQVRILDAIRNHGRDSHR